MLGLLQLMEVVPFDVDYVVEETPSRKDRDCPQLAPELHILRRERAIPEKMLSENRHGIQLLAIVMFL